MSTSLEDACANLRDGSLVGTGYFLGACTTHPCTSSQFRDPDWYCMMRDYWPISDSTSTFPTSSQIVYLRNRILQAAQDLTLAIRLKNEMIKIQERDPGEKISEVRLVKKIVIRSFHGTEISDESDIPMWAAVHSIMFYCTTSSIAASALHNRKDQRESGRSYMAQEDADLLQGTLDQCGRMLPDLEGIKELGWNVFLADMHDSEGAYALHRSDRLRCLREWVTWSNDPYDEQWKSNSTPEDRRGRCYEFGNEKNDEFRTPERSLWPQWAIPGGYLDMYLLRHVRKVEPKQMPRKVEPALAAGDQGKPFAHEFLRPRDEPSASQSQPQIIIPPEYDDKNDPWNYNQFVDLTQESPATDPAAASSETISPEDYKLTVPPMAYDPGSESAGEELKLPEDEWSYPKLPESLKYHRYAKTNKNMADRIGSIKLLAQPGYYLKPMVEEALVPIPEHKSTYSSYLRKVTSYIVAWSGCVSMKTLRGYKRKDDVEWLKLYNYCIARSQLRFTHLYLGTKELAALCGVLENKEEVDALIRPIVNRRFLNHAVTSTYRSEMTSGSIRSTKTGLFTDFEITRRSGPKKKTTSNIQGVLGDVFGWSAFHHESVMNRESVSPHKCFDVIAKARIFVETQRIGY